MKKRSLNNLKLNKQSIASFANQLKGGQVSNSGLVNTCANICHATKEDRLLCNPIDFEIPTDLTPIDYSASDIPAEAATDVPLA